MIQSDVRADVMRRTQDLEKEVIDGGERKSEIEN